MKSENYNSISVTTNESDSEDKYAKKIYLEPKEEKKEKEEYDLHTITMDKLLQI